MVYPTHAMEYYAAIKNNEEDSYIPVWSDLKNTLSDKSKIQAVCRVCYTVCFKGIRLSLEEHSEITFNIGSLLAGHLGS